MQGRDLLCLAILCLLVGGMSLCWCVADEGALEAPEGPLQRPVVACSSLYGDRNPPIPRAPPVSAQQDLDGLNLTRAIFDLNLRDAEQLEAAADGVGLPIQVVTGLTDVDGEIQTRLQAQENRPPAQGPLVVRTPAQGIAQQAMDASIAAAEPARPKFEPLEDLLPSRVWEPVFVGCPPFFVESNCEFYKSEPRLYVEDLDELLYARSLQQGQVNLIEPTRARQTYAQFLMEGVRSKKDPYTRASMTNSVSYGACESLQKKTPDFVVW